MIKCPKCAGEMKFDPVLQKVKCNYCGSEFTNEELEKYGIKYSDVDNEAVSENSFEGKVYKCNQCGAELMTFDDTAVTFCSYCGSQAIIEDKMKKVNNPDLVIPFSITKEQCVEAYKRKVSSFLFAPSYLKSDVVLDKFRGIYMPYGLYNMKHNGPVTFRGTKYSRRVGDYEYYNDYEITANVDASYDGVSYDLSSKFYDYFSTSIPFNTGALVPFDAKYLIGYYADALDVNQLLYKKSANSIVQPDFTRRTLASTSFHGINAAPILDLKYEQKTGMFPVYFMSIRDKKNENIHYAVVNGQTGQVAADLPIDFKKFILGTLAVALLIFAILETFLVATPTKVAAFATIMGIVCFVISNNQISAIKERETHENDLGHEYANEGKNIKVESRISRFKFLYKEVIAIIVPMITCLMGLASDEYYYGAALLSLLLILITIKDLIKEHNLLVSDKLPQLEKRGGDL